MVRKSKRMKNTTLRDWLELQDMNYRDKAHDMNPLIYKNAQVILESESDTGTRRITRTVISFK